MGNAMLVRGRWVITGGGDDDPVIGDGAVLVRGGTVVECGPWRPLAERHPEAAVLGSDEVAVLPGLVNAHHHCSTASALQHGLPDLLLEPWILLHYGLRDSDPYLDTLLSAARLLRTGITSVVDVRSGGGTAEAFAQRLRRCLDGHATAGLRVAFAPGTATRSRLVHGAGEDERFLAGLPADLRAAAGALLPAAGAIGEDEYFGVMDDLRAAAAGMPRIDIWYGPPGPQWVSDACMERVAEEAARHDTGIQTHVEESLYERLHGHRAYGKPTLAHLKELGVLSPRFSIAHGVWVTDAEIEILGETGAAVSHNPSSNLRLRAGIAPLGALLARGVTVALGMDGTTLNDDEDMFTEQRLALRLNRSPRIEESAPRPRDILGLATRGGAALMRKSGRIGRIAPGHAADLVLVDTAHATWPWAAPEADPRDLLVQRARAADVRTVLIDGEVVLQDGRPTRFDLEAAAAEAAAMLAGQAFPAQAAATARRLLPYLEAHYAGWPVPEPAPYICYNART
jgi:cytosine/adenosine deaminase-related metal-dependent hydrolase